jgi:hypothetical protein
MNDNKKYTNSDKIKFVKDMLELGLKKKTGRFDQGEIVEFDCKRG